MEQIIAADWVAKLIKRETETVFGITGGVIITMFDSLVGKGIKIINTHHEQGAAMAADAYARLSGKLGVCLSTSGPGALNLISGTACSYFDSIPILNITGQVPTGQLKKNNVRQFGFQEIDTCSIFKPLTKAQYLIDNPTQIKPEFLDAIYRARVGRPGPVIVDFCDDMQRSVLDDTPIPFLKLCMARNAFDLDKIISYLHRAKRPILIVGGGVVSIGHDYRKKVKKLIEKWKIPTALTWATLDVLDNAHPLNLRDFGVSAQRGTNIAIQEADLLLVLGSRLDTHEAGSNYKTFAPNAIKIVIDIDKSELEKAPYDMIAQTSTQYAIDAFLHNSPDFDFTDWCERIQEVRAMFPICPLKNYKQINYVNPYVFFNELSKVAKPNSVIITDAGGTLTWTMQGWKIKEGQRLITAYNHSPMGYAIPASIGASLACPESDIICITGDGGLMMNIQELNIIKHHNLPVKIFVMNNHEYGIIKQTQDTWLNSRYVASEGPFPDILEIAKAYELRVCSIENHHELKLLPNILKCEHPVLVSVEIKPGEKIIPKLTFGKGIDNPEPCLPDSELNQIKEFLHDKITTRI